MELLDQDEEGEAFFADICSMLEAVAAGCACEISAFTPTPGSSRAACADVIGTVPPRLLRELGVHRAQRAPSHAPLSRIATVRVAVTLLGEGPRSHPEGILRTYNYLTGTAVRHDTGDHQELAMVLSGEAVSSRNDDAEGSPEVPRWTAVEAAALLKELDEQFPDRRVPEGAELVENPSHSDAGNVLEACAGLPWRTLTAEKLWKAQDFWAQVTEAGFLALLPAYVREAVAGTDDLRFEIQGLARDALSPEFQGAERLARRLSHFTPGQLGVLFRFLTLLHRERANAPWSHSEQGVFWRDYLTQRSVPSGPA